MNERSGRRGRMTRCLQARGLKSNALPSFVHEISGLVGLRLCATTARPIGVPPPSAAWGCLACPSATITPPNEFGGGTLDHLRVVTVFFNML